MRIGIDARELAGQPTGVGRYLAGLIGEWASDPRAPEFVLYAPEQLSLSLDTHKFATRIVPGRPGTLWEQVRLPRVAANDHLDVFFSPAYSSPLRFGVPTVVAMHDLSFFAHPEWFRTREGIRRRTIARHSALRAQAIITISEFSRGEIIERLGIPAARIHVIPPGITAPAQATATADRNANVLYVGSIFNRRHVPDLIRGVALLARRRRGVELDVVGDNRSYPHEDVAGAIAQQNAGHAIGWHQYVGDEELASLYSHARAFAFLSEYEGLGLTPLEALTAGVPPLLLDTPVARESCGSAALYVQDTRPRTIADALEELLFDEHTRTRLLAASAAVLERYDWSRAARDTLAVLELAGSAA